MKNHAVYTVVLLCCEMDASSQTTYMHPVYWIVFAMGSLLQVSNEFLLSQVNSNAGYNMYRFKVTINVCYTMFGFSGPWRGLVGPGSECSIGPLSNEFRCTRGVAT